MFILVAFLIYGNNYNIFFMIDKRSGVLFGYGKILFDIRSGVAFDHGMCEMV